MTKLNLKSILAIVKAVGDVMVTVGGVLLAIGGSVECYKALQLLSKVMAA